MSLETQNPEPDTKKILHRELHPKATLPPAADHAPANTIDFRSSDQTLDRYQEIISVAGWKLDNYRKNPVVQNAHSYWSLADTIGKSLITELRDDASRPTLHAPTHLFQRVQFAVDENPLARLAYGLYKGGFLKAVSVGFIPIRWENGSQEASYRRKYLEQELLEVSAVSIPANPNALTLGLKAGAIEKSALKEFVALLAIICGEPKRKADLRSARRPPGTMPATAQDHFCSNPADLETDTSALGGGVYEAQLLQLTKQLNEIRALLRRA